MAAKVFIDRIDTLEAVERYGVVVRLVRRARVIGLDTNTDYQVLSDALTQNGIPAVGSLPTGIPNLVLVERAPRLVDDRVVDVDLTYEHALNDGQNLNSPALGVIFGEISSTLSQENSNLDREGNQVSVQYTYSTDPLVEPDTTLQGKTFVQGGQFQYFEPQTDMKFSGIFSTPLPWLLKRGMEARVNASPWQGAPTAEWLCTNVSYRLCDARASSNRYFFSFSFQRKSGGWNPQIQFLDTRTGKPPVALVQDVGYKTVDKYPTCEFELVLGARLQGG